MTSLIELKYPPRVSTWDHAERRDRRRFLVSGLRHPVRGGPEQGGHLQEEVDPTDVLQPYVSGSCPSPRGPRTPPERPGHPVQRGPRHGGHAMNTEDALLVVSIIEVGVGLFFGWLSSDYMRLLWRIKMQ